MIRCLFLLSMTSFLLACAEDRVSIEFADIAFTISDRFDDQRMRGSSLILSSDEGDGYYVAVIKRDSTTLAVHLRSIYKAILSDSLRRVESYDIVEVTFNNGETY